MKTLSFYLVFFVLFLSIKIDAQDMNTWRISVGYSNFSKSDDLLIGNQYSNFNNFNFPNTLSIEKRIHNNFSFKFSGTVNEFEKLSPIQNLSINQKNDLFLGLDLALKYSLMGEKGKSTWFNPFLTAGIGYSKFDTFGDTKLTAGVGSNFWIKKNFGIQIGSTYNKSIALENSNYLNHFVGFIVLFNRNIKTDFVENNNTNELKKSEENQTIIATNDSKIENKDKKVKTKDKVIERNQIADLKKFDEEKSMAQNIIAEVKSNENSTIISDNSVKKELVESNTKIISSENTSEKVITNQAIKTEETNTPLKEVEKTKEITNTNLIAVKTENKNEVVTIQNEITSKKVEIKDEKIEKPIEEIVPKTNTKVESNVNELKTERVLDSDGDKVPDEFDKCPTVFGEATNAGCPKKTELATNNKSNPISTNQNISNSENNDSKVENNESILKVTNVYFDMDDAKVLDDERSKIHMIIYIMDKNPNSKIIIEGHTAKDGDIDYNKKLSENRAKAVKQYLINKGVNAGRIEIKSLGSSQPVSSENTEKAKALNRRARIVLTK